MYELAGTHNSSDLNLFWESDSPVTVNRDLHLTEYRLVNMWSNFSVATLPLYLDALTGRNCQFATVNDYLARRDSEWMGYLYNLLGLSVGCIQSGMDSDERHEQYDCNITYGTSSEFGFDYLRDNGLASSLEEQVQKDHYFCIVDEIDSILIDEARTPLIISGPSLVKL